MARTTPKITLREEEKMAENVRRRSNLVMDPLLQRQLMEKKVTD